jgi:CRP-like cAMP-binding protein
MKYCYYLLQGDKPDKVYFIVEGNITVIKEISIAVRNRCGDVCTVNAIGLMIAPFSMDALYYLFYSNPCCFLSTDRWPKSKSEWDVATKKSIKNHVVCDLSKGDYFGEYAILSNKNRSATARARTK